MSELNLTPEDVQKVKASALKTKDRFEREGFTSDDDHESMDLLIEFCDLLLGGRHAGTLQGFLTGQDMETDD
jgi:hypothetical protein